MFKVVFVIAFALVVAVANAQCYHVDKVVSSSQEFEAACRNARSGWNIILKKGSYVSPSGGSFFLRAVTGTRGCPVTVTCKKPGEAVLTSPLDISTSSYVTVSNIMVSNQDADGWGIYLKAADSVTIENVRFSECTGQGLILQASSHVTVRNCTFESVGDSSMWFDDTYGSMVKGNTFGDKLAFDDGVNVIYMLHDSSSNVFTDNFFNGKSGSFLYWIDCRECTNNEFTNNVFQNSDGRAMRDGVIIHEGSNNLFKENFMVFNPDGQPYPDGFAFRVGDTKQRICASNKVSGTTDITDGEIDSSC